MRQRMRAQHYLVLQLVFVLLQKHVFVSLLLDLLRQFAGGKPGFAADVRLLEAVVHEFVLILQWFAL